MKKPVMLQTFLSLAVLALALPQASSAVSKLSVIWDSMNGRFQVKNDALEGREVLAVGIFDDRIHENGWGFLDVRTNSFNGFYLDYQQAFAAGLVEAHLTKDLIEKQWRNEYMDYCQGKPEYCKELESFLEENLAYILDMVKLYSSTDRYWHQVGLALVQLAGIEAGLRKDPFYVYVGDNLTPNVSAVMQMSLHGDLPDLENKLRKTKKSAPGVESSCSALIALTKGNADLLAGHSTWSGYNTMLRIQKRYSFSFNETFDSRETIPAKEMAFSSYPGRLISGDDFYLMSSGLLVSETTIENNNLSLYEHTTARGTVPSWLRNIVANRLARTAREWAELYSYNNSGTYNNQWLILDYKQFKAGQPLPNGTFHVLEQMPGFIRHEDMTWFLQKFGYWPGYNVAYFPEIFNMSGQWDLVKKYGDYFTYDKTSRALLFQRDHGRATSIEGLRRLLRSNDFEHDSLSRCNCSPPFSAENAIAARSDLNPANGTYPFTALGHRPHGATDVKVTNSKMARELSMLIQCGPTNDQQPTFSWSSSDFGDSVRHEGQPDVFDFPPVLSRWSTN